MCSSYMQQSWRLNPSLKSISRTSEAYGCVQCHASSDAPVRFTIKRGVRPPAHPHDMLWEDCKSVHRLS